MDGINDSLSRFSASGGRTGGQDQMCFIFLNITVTRKLSQIINSPGKTMNEDRKLLPALVYIKFCLL